MRKSKLAKCGWLKAAPLAPLRDRGVQNRLPARIFTVDISPGERKIPSVRFPNSDKSFVLPVFVLGMNETCEEKL
jgi:hypothetical protein